MLYALIIALAIVSRGFGKAKFGFSFAKKLLGNMILASPIVNMLPIEAFGAVEVNPSTSHPVVVIGGAGKTGKQIVDLLAKQSISVRSAVREVKSSSTTNPLVENVVIDVTKPSTIDPAIQDASAVIFAASASSRGGNAKQVDYLGVENVAAECVKLNIPRLVVISSGAVTRPDSLGYKITNLFGNIMEYKVRGEQALQAIYNQAPNAQDVSYEIIRPGGLLDGPRVGPSKVELNQGDTILYEINRADVAECAVAAALSHTIPSNTIFEIYELGKGVPLEPRFPSKSGYERSGSSYEEMFAGLKTTVVPR
jgi:nucleoside-diphosphate-sugar epimerase